MWDGVKGTFLANFRSHVGPVYQVCKFVDVIEPVAVSVGVFLSGA